LHDLSLRRIVTAGIRFGEFADPLSDPMKEKRVVLRTELCELLGIEYPIMLAGMGAVARSDLVAAVSNAGGLGVLGAVGLPLDVMRQEIRRVKELTDKPFAVDIVLPPMRLTGEMAKSIPKDLTTLLPAEHVAFVEELKARLGVKRVSASEGPALELDFTPDIFDRQVEIILEEGAPHFATGLGNPAPYVGEMHRRGMKIISLCGNVKNARRLADAGVDVVVAQGYEAGGHTGRVGTLALVPQVVDAVGDRVLVAAAGGIGDGRGLVAALALGACGVWMGTRFLATPEAGIPDVWKQKIVAMTEEDTKVTRSFTGKTARVINNAWVEAWEQGKLDPLPMPLQSILIQDVLRGAVVSDNADALFMASGQVGGMIRELKPAGQVLRDVVAEAEEVLSRLPKRVASR
jgi:NAD(P)H-dependent flavin oxidoreductase YrpB (nitropropane dioxygenase family)